MKNFRLILIAGLLVFPVIAKAQQANTLYFMDRVFASQTVNIAEIPENGVQVGGLIVPIFGQLPPQFYFNYGNNSFHYNHIIHHGTGLQKDSLVLDMPLLMKKVRKNTCIRGEFKLDYFNFSYRTKSDAIITVNLSDRVLYGTTIPRSMFDFMLRGNKQYMDEGTSCDLQKLSFGMSAFHELGVGFTTSIREKFSVGGRMKLLFGIADISTKVNSLEITTDPEMYFITASADMKIRKSTGIMDYNNDSLQFSDVDELVHDLASLGNLGLAIDLGVNYKITEKISVSFSATDIGFINWLQNAQVASANGEYTFEGVELGFKENDEGKLGFGIDTSRYNAQHIADTLIDLFDMEIRDKSYMTWLPSNVYLGATYKFNDKLGFGVLYRGEIYRNTYMQSVTLSVNSNITHWLSLHGSWSLMNGTALNVGLGFSARLGFITWYMVTDDIIGIIFPQRAKTLNIRMGCNLTFGHQKKVLSTTSRL